MKMLFAECCADIVVPDSIPRKARWCKCHTACVWWDDPHTGKLAVFSHHGKKAMSVLGLSNDLLVIPFSTHEQPDGRIFEYGCIQGDRIKQLIEETPSSYVFKQVGSLIIRVRPGFSNDVRLASLEESWTNSKPEDRPQPRYESADSYVI